MVKVSIEVRSGAARFDVAIQAREHPAGGELRAGAVFKGQRQGEVPDRARELLCGGSRGSKRDSWPGASGKGGGVKFSGKLAALCGVLLLCCVSRAWRSVRL